VTKTWIVAASEFGMLVRTKAFIVTILLMPVLFLGSVAIQALVAGQVDLTPRRFAVLDHSGKLYPAIERAARERKEGAPFIPERVEPSPGETPDVVRLAQSERVLRDEIAAFVELPADAYLLTGSGSINYHSDQPTYGDLRRWLEQVVNAEVAQARLRDAGIDPLRVAALARPVAADNLGLFVRGPAGELRAAEKVDVVRTYVVPIALMLILFMTIIVSAPQLMNAVIQEKLSKISEVLIGSVSSFELMMGKLLGSTGMSLVMSLVYIGGGLGVAANFGYGGAVPPSMFGYFLLFLVLAVLLYGSLFIAIGAACSDIKDAQSLVTPVMLVAMVPIFAWQVMLKSPMSPLAVFLTLFPTATPFMMLMRVAVQPAPPAWQIAAGIVLCTATTVALVWAAGRIFRIGILAQGKSPGFAQMIRWLRVK
jgi:ABC-2 type transport system permease protein